MAALVVPTALGIYFFLPALGKNRKWEKLLLIAGFVIAIGILALGLIVDGARSIVRHFDVWLMVIFVFTFVPTVAFKILVWLWQGVRRQEK